MFLDDGLHIVDCFFPAAVAEGAGFELSEDCKYALDRHENLSLAGTHPSVCELPILQTLLM